MNKMILQSIQTIKDNAVKNLCKDLLHCTDDDKDFVNMIIKAHNRVCEDELDGQEYIFHIDNKEDIKCLLDGGTTMAELTRIGNTYFNGDTTGYLFIDDKSNICIFEKNEALRGFLSARLARIVGCILAYPYVEEYQKLYYQFVTRIMEQESIVME